MMHKAVSFIVWHSLKNMEVEEKLSQIIWGLYVDFYFESLSNFQYLSAHSLTHTSLIETRHKVWIIF